MTRQASVISHWYQLIENFQTSSLSFYKSLEAALEGRFVPEIHSTRVQHKEGNLASANRQYLRIHRGKYAFDICAAPFGSGFFISWWFTEPPLAYGFLYTLAILFGVFVAFDFLYLFGMAIGTGLSGVIVGVFFGATAAFLGVPALLWIIGNGIHTGGVGSESTILAIPWIGGIYERIFAPTTYYAVDTGLMFQQTVHNAVLEVIDCLTQEKGIRALSEAERKPILKSFSASA